MISFKKQYSVFICLFFCCLATNLYSQASSSAYHHFTSKDGLPSDHVYGAMQDRDGYIWIYTEKGIFKFDGYTFKTFQKELPKSDVWGLTEDSQGRLWVHTVHDRLVYIYQDSIHEIITPGNIRFYIYSFNETDGVIWFTSRSTFEGNKTKSETFYIRNDTAIHQPLALTMHQKFNSLNPVTSFPLKTSFKSLILLKKDSLLRYDYNGQLQNIKRIDSKSIERYAKSVSIYSSASQYLKNELFITCNSGQSGFLLWNHEQGIAKTLLYEEIYGYPVNPQYTPGYFTDNSFQATLMPSPGFLEVDLALNLLDTFSVKGINYRRIFKDRQRNYWITTNDDGVYFLSADARNATNYTYENDNNITRLVGNDSGQIFLSTANGGLYTLQEQQQLIPLAASKQIGKNLKALSLTADGKLYAGADLGSLEILINDPISNSISKNFNALHFDKSERMESYFSDFSGIINFNFSLGIKINAWDELNKTLWFSDGKYIANINFSKTALPAADLISLNGISELAIGQNNEVWAAGSGGVWKIKNGQSQGMQSIHPYFKRNVNDLVVDQYNILWVATDHDGIFGYRNDSIYFIPSSKNSITNDLFFDRDGFLWAATDGGILQFKIDPDNYDEQKLIRSYNTNDGILANEINAVFVNQQYIYAGTSKGLSKIDKAGKYGDDSLPLLHIKEIRINGIKNKIKDKYILTHHQKNIEIDFVALSYKSLGDIDYSYQLEGVDQHWQETKNTTLKYASLSPGVYTFHLKAKDIENRESELLQTLVFEIKPPFWERGWFRLLVLAMTAGIIWLIYKRRINIIKKEEAEKTRIAKKMAELELKALQSQMNPHFVFNALASIRFYIQNNQPDEAGDYLARFAKLMRMFLESSKNNLTSVEEEIKLITLYIEMEQLRFEEQFEFELNVDDDIDVYMMKIPTLLLQPFVENSINHGLFHKDGKGLLQINFRLEGDELIICTIEDDGIGREASGEIAKRSSKGHKSRGMQIVGERLEVLKHKDGLDVGIEIIDLKDVDGRNAGTRVVLSIPLFD